MEEKATNTPKKKKKPFVPMEMAKVPLDPQQAVLSCCDSLRRDMVLGEWGTQCWEPCDGINAQNDIAS